VLRRAAALIRERTQRLAELEVDDCGKPICEALDYDIPSSAEVLVHFAGLATTISGRHVSLGADYSHSHFYTRREPLGVCAGIGAWNYPFQIAAWKAAPALACGNSLVYKPSELTPLSTVLLAEILSEAGLPPGVFSVVQGGGSVGRQLAEHPEVAKVSLTGSVPTGQAVMASAAAELKSVTMELGGKSPLIIFDDCDLDSAVNAALLGNFYTQGEVCTNGTRVFVHAGLEGRFLEALLERCRSLRIGDPRDPATTIGALISAAHRDRVEAYVQSGIDDGAQVHRVGDIPDEAPLASGYFVQPTIFTGCDDAMRIVREEIFGPVMSVLSFQDEAEVVKRANATRFGLAAGVFTRDLKRGHRVAADLEAGICWLNNYNIAPIEMPFGGVKRSGIGRENGIEAIEHYTQVKSVYVEMGTVPNPFSDT